MKKSEAYRIVFDDLTNGGCNLFVGRYDARHGNEDFMYGIATVMETIAYRVSEEAGDEYGDIFSTNMVASQRKAKERRDTNEKSKQAG